MRYQAPFCITAISALCSFDADAASTSFGPLLQQTQAPLQITGFRPVLQDPFSWTEGKSEFFASGTAASVWAESPEFDFDYYHNQLWLGLKHALNDKWKLGVDYHYAFVGNNHLDTLTNKFHDVFGINQNGRDEAGKHRSYISIRGENGKTVESFNGDTINNSLTAYIERSIYQTEQHAFSAGISLSYNYVGHGVFRNALFEQGFQVNYGFKQDSGHRFIASAIVIHRPDKQQHLVSVEDLGLMGGFSYQYQLSDAHALIGEYYISQGKGSDMGQLDDIVHEFTLGYRFIFDNSAIELSAVENMVNHDNSSDIVLTATYRIQFNL